MAAPTISYDKYNYPLAFNFPESGEYILTGCITEKFIEDEQTSGELSIGWYYIKSHIDLVITGFTPITGDLIEITSPITPTWGFGKVQSIITGVDLEIGKIYKILYIDSIANMDFTVFGAVDNTVGEVFVCTDTTYTTTWEGEGAVIEMTPIDERCTTLNLECCDEITLEQSSCNSFTIYNRQAVQIILSTQKFNGTDYTAYTDEIVLDPFTTTPLEILEDGIYNIKLEIPGQVESTYMNYIRFVFCAIETCKKRYLDALICCNTETNCSGCTDDNCEGKDYYDFNAFSILMNAYFTLANREIFPKYVYSNSEITSSEKIQDLIEIQTLIDRASQYCLECNTPCNNTGTNNSPCTSC